MLEEMCLTEENSMQPPSNIEAQKDQNLSYEEPVDSRNSPLDQEAENEDAASEMDGNIGSEPIDDAVEGEMEEQRMGQELEHVDQSSGLSKDKQTDQCCKDLEKDEPVAKKMKLISHSAGKLVASPMKGISLERTKSCSVEPPPRPRISRIETFHYTVPIKKIEKCNLNWFIQEVKSFWYIFFFRIIYIWDLIYFLLNNNLVPREIQIPLVNQSPGSMITKESSVRNQNNPNPSSMFTPGHYDYSDNSEISFCIDENMAELKGTCFILLIYFSWIYL